MITREHQAQGVAERTGAGVYYGAAVGGPAFTGRRVLVVGGGNSAGQAALYLSRYARQLQIVTAATSAGTMSHYLVVQIEKTPKIRMRARTELAGSRGPPRRRVGLNSLVDGECRTRTFDAVFIFIGTRPHSDWLPPDVLRDEKGFVRTGRDLLAVDGFTRIWKNGASRCCSKRAFRGCSRQATSAPGR